MLKWDFLCPNVQFVLFRAKIRRIDPKTQQDQLHACTTPPLGASLLRERRDGREERGRFLWERERELREGEGNVWSSATLWGADATIPKETDKSLATRNGGQQGLTKPKIARTGTKSFQNNRRALPKTRVRASGVTPHFSIITSIF